MKLEERVLINTTVATFMSMEIQRESRHPSGQPARHSDGNTYRMDFASLSKFSEFPSFWWRAQNSRTLGSKLSQKQVGRRCKWEHGPGSWRKYANINIVHEREAFRNNGIITSSCLSRLKIYTRICVANQKYFSADYGPNTAIIGYGWFWIFWRLNWGWGLWNRFKMFAFLIFLFI